jgi:hypothetical protein
MAAVLQPDTPRVPSLEDLDGLFAQGDWLEGG